MSPSRPGIGLFHHRHIVPARRQPLYLGAGAVIGAVIDEDELVLERPLLALQERQSGTQLLT